MLAFGGYVEERLKYALTYREVVAIVMQRLIAIDGKVRTDKCYPAGFMGEWLLIFMCTFANTMSRKLLPSNTYLYMSLKCTLL